MTVYSSFNPRLIASFKSNEYGKTRVHTEAASKLRVKVYPTGKKVFQVCPRVDGKRKTITIGNVDDINLAEAREEAMYCSRKARLGQPLEEDIEVPEVITIAEMAHVYIELKTEADWVAAKTIEKNEG